MCTSKPRPRPRIGPLRRSKPCWRCFASTAGPTQGRRLLLAALLQPGHHTAEEIAATVRQQAPDVHLTTIYRNLDELERLHVVDRTYVSHGPATYRLAAAAHRHLACESCGAIAELPGEAFQTLRDMAMSMHGFAINPSHFAVPGHWAHCQ
jgi:Fur family transcriptional regulator, ferric uptake regulator